MPEVKSRIIEAMKSEANPLVYLEFTPKKKLKEYLNPQFLFTPFSQVKRAMRICMGFVSKPYENTYRITTCRHLFADDTGAIPSKAKMLNGLEIFARYEGVNKKFHSPMLEDVNIKVHDDIIADLLFVEITHPDDYNFKLLNQASARCRRRFPGSQVYYFQNIATERYFRLFEGKVTRAHIYITGITNNGYFRYEETEPNVHHRRFHTIHTTEDESINGASGSPILSRRGEVIGMMCAHHQSTGKGIYLSIEKMDRLYAEIEGYHL